MGTSALAAPPALAPGAALDLYRAMLTARWADILEMELVDRGEAFFHLSGSGHEASAALAAHLGPRDWLQVHYRQKGLMIARGMTSEDLMHNVLCTARSQSAGRQMSAHPSAPDLRILSIPGPVGNGALHAVGVAREVLHAEGAPVVLCAGGDGSSQQGEFLEAIAEAVRSHLPVLFWIEDNGLAISTRTRGQTLYDLPGGPAAEFLGLPVHRVDGRDPLAVDAEAARLVRQVREGRGPALCVMSVERLSHHTNADDERVYRPAEERERAREEGDPVRRLREDLLAAGVGEDALAGIEAEVEAEVRAAAERALTAPDPEPALTAVPPLPDHIPAPPAPATDAPLTMLEAMREVLRAHLATDPRVSVYGEDIEDPKGDVFGLTRGLSTDFPGRVANSPLSESTIVGVAVGRALAGGRPVACMQFADFMPLAFNQIITEMATMYWRTDGGWDAGVVVMAPCGGYRPGLGPWHAATHEAVLGHVPGIDVVMPSTAADAAGLLNAALATGRPTVFLYPKTCLNDPTLAAPPACVGEVVRPGAARVVEHGEDLTIVTWGSTVRGCQAAVRALASAGITCDLIDLRAISPWDADAVVQSARRTGRLLVAHEDALTGGFGAEVVATVAERVPGVAVRRVARPDTHVPCNYNNQIAVLPSLRDVLEVAGEMLGLDVRFTEPHAEDGVLVIEAAGSSPADQQVMVLEWLVGDGDEVRAGDMIAECEADKATFELRAPATGVIAGLHAEADPVPVGTPIARITLAAGEQVARRRIPAEPVPHVDRRTGAPALPGRRREQAPVERALVALGRPVFVPGGREVSSEELAAGFPDRSVEDILRRTGIRSRRFLAEGETITGLAADAARMALDEAGLDVADLEAIYVATGTPPSISPSLACLVHHRLAEEGTARDVAASDILAACSGYLYALQAAWDLCQQRPEAAVLVVTAEAMSQYLDPGDFDTAVVFGDAATATVVRGPARLEGAWGLLHRPLLAARGEDGRVLSQGIGGTSPVHMDGPRVYQFAVREMLRMLERACADEGIAVTDLDLVVPHQANARIIDAIRARSGLGPEHFVVNVDRWGNTSSSTIPLALAELAARVPAPSGRVGLVTFGAGFTSASAILDLDR